MLQVNFGPAVLAGTEKPVGKAFKFPPDSRLGFYSVAQSTVPGFVAQPATLGK
jgi:hypothetical protein